MADGPTLINRDLSWLEFDRRVLEEAQDASVPLLERLKFLAICGSNLDEFFMIRVGGLQQLREAGRETADGGGLTVEEQLAEISRRAHALAADQYGCLLKEVEPALAAAGIRRVAMGDLTPEHLPHVERVFDQEIYPVLTPMAIPAPEDFPLLPGLGVCLAIRLSPPKDAEPTDRFALIALPRKMARILPLPRAEGYPFVLAEDAVRAFAGKLFPGVGIAETAVFRITRNADMSVREDLAGDLLAQMRELLNERKRSDCVRLEISQGASKAMMGFFRAGLELDDRDVYETPGPLDLGYLHRVAGLAGFDSLRHPPWPAQTPPDAPATESIFDVLARHDLLLVHPYDSFDPVLRLVEQAADDPDVLAIKQILYRTSENSPVVAALGRAAERGKHVTAIVELKARFDEARNIAWARALEQSGVQVIYGVRGFKTHAKVCLVIRREASGIRRYVHLSTGNYNEITARVYSDVSYLTCQDDFGADASVFFNTITGYSEPVRYRKIEAAPLGLRASLLNLIEGEAERSRQGQKGRILAKVNSLADAQVIEALYAASQAGVEIQLNVRGICCLRPGVPGLSERITVVSIVDRFLEHSRVFCFEHGGEPHVYISSADWMPRNLDRRIELLLPVEPPACRARLIGLLELCFQDSVKARRLTAEGAYERVKGKGRKGAVRLQEALYREACERAQQDEHRAATVFEPIRPAAGDAKAGS